MARETVSWTDAKGVTHTRKVKRASKLRHLFAFTATGGASAIVTAAKVASDAAYNEGTRQRIERDMKPARVSRKTRDRARVEPGTCKLCDKPDCDGTRHLPR